MLSTPLPPVAELDPLLKPYAARDADGRLVEDGNELLRFLSAAPEHAADVLRVHFERWLSSPLGARLSELVRLAVAERTGCPICRSIRRPGARREGLDESLRDHGLFVAFAPAEDPRVVVAVVVENGGGSSAAVPVARRILDSYFALNEYVAQQR